MDYIRYMSFFCCSINCINNTWFLPLWPILMNENEAFYFTVLLFLIDDVMNFLALRRQTNVLQRYWNRLLRLWLYILYSFNAPWLLFALCIVCISFYVIKHTWCGGKELPAPFVCWALLPLQLLTESVISFMLYWQLCVKKNGLSLSLSLSL